MNRNAALFRRIGVCSLLLIFGALWAGCSFRQRQQVEVEPTTIIPREVERSLNVEGRQRYFILHLPPAYDGTTALPLVIVLHGGGGNALNAMQMSGMSEKADDESFIVVYPQGSGRLDEHLLTWNAGNCCGVALDEQVDDVEFMRALLDRLENDYTVDPGRIYVTGISNGGMMAYRLGCELSDRIAAIAPVAGAMNVEDCSPSDPVSIIIFHGTADQRVLYDGGEPIEQPDRHPRVDQPVAYAVDFWRAHNDCPESPQVQQTGMVRFETYEPCRAGSALTLYTIEEGGHAWPGGEKGFAGADEPTQEISATDLMWDFFARHHK